MTWKLRKHNNNTKHTPKRNRARERRGLRLFTYTNNFHETLFSQPFMFSLLFSELYVQTLSRVRRRDNRTIRKTTKSFCLHFINYLIISKNIFLYSIERGERMEKKSITLYIIVISAIKLLLLVFQFSSQQRKMIFTINIIRKD